MREIVQLLKGSDRPEDDIAIFMRTCIVFWMLGATDGHAKNFSVFLDPGGRFRMTPMYDVLTAQPSLDAGQIQRKKFKLAMSVGKNRHYPVLDIMPRHFVQTADIAGVGKSLMRAIFDDLSAHAMRQADGVISSLPDSFPDELVDSVRSAIEARASLLAETKDAALA